MSTALPRLWTFKTSPFAGKVRAAFAEKGVEVELVEIHPTKRPPRLKELSRPNRVPVLEVGDVAIRESSIICEWLEETHPEPALWPADPAVRGWARAQAKWIDDALLANFFLGMRKMAFGKDDSDPDDIVEQLHARLAYQWPTLEAMLALHEGPWIMGEQFTYAELSGMPLAIRMPEWTPQLVPSADEFPLTTAWLQAIRERPTAVEIDAEGAERLSA